MITISLKQAITLDTVDVITGTRRDMRINALSGDWVNKSDGSHFCFAAVRVYQSKDGQLAVEVGSFKDDTMSFSTGMYRHPNRNPLAIDIVDSNVIAEAPFEEWV